MTSQTIQFGHSHQTLHYVAKKQLFFLLTKVKHVQVKLIVYRVTHKNHGSSKKQVT